MALFMHIISKFRDKPMRNMLTAALFLSLCSVIVPQSRVVKGTVSEKGSGIPLAYANIRITEANTGTSTNKSGEYEIKLLPGRYRFITSYIGYISDTTEVNITEGMPDVDIRLAKTNVNLEEIVIKPGENPAVAVIKKAIEKKKKRNAGLHSYQFEAYTKGLVRTSEDMEAGDNSVSIGLGSKEKKDTAKLQIAGIIENQSVSYFKEPSYYKEIITARKQTANIPASINILTGSRLIKNFYEDEINFLGKNLPGPLADDALDYYYYFIEGQVSIDNSPVYVIHIEPDISTDPGFTGSLYIKDSTYDLIKVDLRLNRAANTGGIFDTVNVFQQFAAYNDSVYMPADYRLLVNATILNLMSFGFELNTILHSYKINTPIDDEFFDMAVVKVMPQADNKDSLYWMNVQTIPNTMEEQLAYIKIDSVNSAPKTFWDKFSFLSTRINWTDNLSTSAPLAVYHFNRVEGHSLDYGFYLNNAAGKRLNSSLDLSYGFSDKKFKKSLSASWLFGEYRTTELSVSAYDKVNILFENSDNYNELTSTIMALLLKEEFRDYYYSKGFNASIATDVFPVLRLNAGFFNRTDNNAFVNSDFSFFKKDREVKPNSVINEVKLNALTAGFVIDFRNYIEDGFYRRRIERNDSHIILEGNAAFSDKGLVKSDMDFTRYQLTMYGRVKTFSSAGFNFRCFAQYSNKPLPYQMLYALPGNINIASTPNSFKTLTINESIGQNAAVLFLEHNWSDMLFRASGIPGLKTSELMLTTYINAAYSDISNENKAIIPAEVKTFRNPFYEAGFSIGHVLSPIQLDFTWKLNHRGDNNFRVGISSFIF